MEKIGKRRGSVQNVISQAREIVEDVITSPKGNRKVKVSLVK